MGRHKKSMGLRQLEVVSARIKVEFHRQVKDIAERRDVSITQLVREALHEFVDRHGEKKAA